MANQTLEDYSLRYTARSVRKLDVSSVVMTSIGSISFLALEVIGANIAIFYGLNHLILALLITVPLIFVLSHPIAKYASIHHIDIDLLTRGAGFGYIGSSITSLIYATFTFIFMALESAILAKMLNITLGMNLSLGYLLCSLVIIPLVMHGFSFISRLQKYTEPVWAVLQILAVYGLIRMSGECSQCFSSAFEHDSFNAIYLGYSICIVLALISQIGEQVDYIRFMPEYIKSKRKAIIFGTIISGPLWIVLGGLKILIGALLAVMLISKSADYMVATDPTYMYMAAFSKLYDNHALVMFLTILFVAISQIKINVTNGYAGSIAWSNFFARMTHTHPGRIVWVFFNVFISWMLLICGVYEIAAAVLNLYSILAISWCASLSADLSINKRIGLSPKEIEFRRSKLYDINPVGFISMFMGVLIGTAAYTGLFGSYCEAYSAVIALVVAYVLTPVIAYVTDGRYYLNKETSNEKTHNQTQHNENKNDRTCNICGNSFDHEDLCYCPYYKKQICSLCCTLESGCNGQCRKEALITNQICAIFPFLKQYPLVFFIFRLLGFMTVFSLINLSILYIGFSSFESSSLSRLFGNTVFLKCFILIEIVTGIFTMLFVLVSDSRNLAQEQTEKNHKALENEIEERIKVQHQLVESKRNADAANMAKSRYLSGISHELRTPLNSILGYCQILSSNKNSSNDSSAKGLNIISRNAEYLCSLIEGLLDISKIEIGKLDLNIRKIRVEPLLKDLIMYFRTKAKNKNLIFEYIEHSHLPAFVKTDENRLRQILTNLLSNAVKYTPKGKVTFEVSYRSDVALFVVKDTGIGIAKKDLKRIFEPFTRTDSARKCNSGSGIGLTITNLLSVVMGGELTVESTVGEGSEFRLKIYLPRENPDQEEMENYSRVIGYKTEDKKKIRILTVDDNEDHRVIIRTLLSPLGFEIEEANGFDSAMKLIGKENFDLFFVDYSMPGHNGLYLAKNLRKKGINSPIIMVSANASELKINDSHDRRIYDYHIVKPFRKEQLLDAIVHFLPIDYICQDNLKKDESTSETDRITALESTDKKDSSSEKEKSENKTSQLADAKNLTEQLRIYLETGFVKGILNNLDTQHNLGLLSEELFLKYKNKAERFDFEYIRKDIQNS